MLLLLPPPAPVPCCCPAASLVGNPAGCLLGVPYSTCAILLVHSITDLLLLLRPAGDSGGRMDE
jgi:hypothetical protein